MAKSMGSDASEMTESINKMRDDISRGELQAALEKSKNGRKIAEKVTGKFIEAHDLCEALEKLVQNSERFYVDVREAEEPAQGSPGGRCPGRLEHDGHPIAQGPRGHNEDASGSAQERDEKGKEHVAGLEGRRQGRVGHGQDPKGRGMAMKREKYEETLDRLIEFKAEMKRV